MWSKVITTIPTEEENQVMELILNELRKNTNWNKMPIGFAGAFLLAQKREQTRAKFKAFCKEVMPITKVWLKPHIKDADWLND